MGPAHGLTPAGLDGPRTPRLDLPVLAHAILAKDVLLPFVGRAWTEQIMAPLAKSLAAHEPTSFAAVIVVVWAGLLAFAVIKSRQWQPRLLFCLGLYLVFVSFTASVEASRADWQLTHASALGAGRYYYLPNVFLGLALLMAAGPGSALPVRFRRTALVLVVWMLAVGSNEFFRSDARPLFFTGTDWKRQVTAWRLGETRELTIWPAPWKIALDRDSSSSGVVTATSGPAAAQTTVEVYTRSGCPHCSEARRFLEQLAAERTDLSIVEHDVARDSQALERLRVLSARAGGRLFPLRGPQRTRPP
jgi:glutaredoxin